LEHTLSIIRLHPVAFYFTLVYTLAWAVWIPLAIARRGASGNQVNLSLTLLAGAAPSVAATLTTWVAFGRKGVAHLWRRLIWWRISPPWYLAALLIPAILAILTAALVVLFTGLSPAFFAGTQPASLMIGLLIYIPMAVFEEVGWRGFAQPGLQARLSALGASAILGMAWSIWHLPYFLIPEFSFFPADSLQRFITGFAIYSLGTIPTCILMAWLFNNSTGSLVLPCVFHGATNVFSGTFLIPLIRASGFIALVLSAGLSTLAAAVVLVVFGYRRLVRGSVGPEHPAFFRCSALFC
jgi:membrane protease YdiL (CAAX protease family)